MNGFNRLIADFNGHLYILGYTLTTECSLTTNLSMKS